jgi:hypothetical protein
MSASPEQHGRATSDPISNTQPNTQPSTQPSTQPGTQHSTQPSSDPTALSERDLRILDFERRWWRHAGAKEEAIRAEFDLSAARYYQLLNAVIDLPGATRTDPMLVKRLQRARSDRMRARSAHAFTRSRSSETTSATASATTSASPPDTFPENPSASTSESND